MEILTYMVSGMAIAFLILKAVVRQHNLFILDV